MTDQTLKTLLVNALGLTPPPAHVQVPSGVRQIVAVGHDDVDRLATAIHDHYASALVEALKIKAAFNWPDEALPKLFSDCADGTMVRLRGNIASLSRFGGSQ